ncbi:MAG TPA: hypothetical protein ENI87_10800 [bacterium]|nr:hypothetical protein [bacterium]
MLALLALPVACAVPHYSPCPLDLEFALPANAFQRCRSVLVDAFGTLVHSDPAAFRLQTAWQPIADPPGERRASVYRDPTRDNSLAIIVELRRLTVPWFGPPRWTTVQGDALAERELAERLRAALCDPLPPDR